MRLLAQARNPYSRSWLWIPGSRGACHRAAQSADPLARPGMTGSGRSRAPQHKQRGGLPRRARSGASIGVRRKKFSPKKPARKTKLLSRFNKSTRRANHPKPCPARFGKIFRLTRRANQCFRSARLTRLEGRLAIVTDAPWDAEAARVSTD